MLALGSLPNSAVSLGQVSLMMVLLFFAILFTLTFVKDRPGLLRKLVSPEAAILVLGAAVVLVWSQVLKRPEGNLHLTVLEAGSTETLLIRSPTGQSVLINGAPGFSPPAGRPRRPGLLQWRRGHLPHQRGGERAAGARLDRWNT